MTTEELKETMDDIITKTFSRLEKVYLKHKEGFSDTFTIIFIRKRKPSCFPSILL